MYLSTCTDIFSDLTLEEMLDQVRGYGLRAVELTTGGWGAHPFAPPGLIRNEDARGALLKALSSRGMHLSALNCSGNPLAPGAWGAAHAQDAYRAAELAGQLGVKTLVMMSGLPGGAPGDRIPNWITSTVSWPACMPEAARYQWEDAALPWWREFLPFVRDHGVERVAIEAHPGQLVYSARTFFRLCGGVGGALSDLLGVNLDPSHLFALGGDPIAAARALGGKIFYIHGKDARIERGLSQINGLPEPLPVECCADRVWNYVAVGCGHDLQWWREFFSVVRMQGYNGAVSLEMEDLTMSAASGIRTSLDVLFHTISQ